MINETKIYPDWKPSTLSIVLSIVCCLSYVGIMLSPIVFSIWMVFADNYAVPLIIMYLFMITCSLAMSVIMIISQWKILTKAGQPGWKCLIPVYNTWTLYEVAGYQGYYSLLGFIPVVGTVIALIAAFLVSMSLAMKFGKSKAWGVVLLALLAPVGYTVLGFSENTYIASAGHQMDEGLFE